MGDEDGSRVWNWLSLLIKLDKDVWHTASDWYYCRGGANFQLDTQGLALLHESPVSTTRVQ